MTARPVVTWSKRAGSSPSTRTAPAAQLPARPMLTSPSGPVRVCRVPCAGCRRRRRRGAGGPRRPVHPLAAGPPQLRRPRHGPGHRTGELPVLTPAGRASGSAPTRAAAVKRPRLTCGLVFGDRAFRRFDGSSWTAIPSRTLGGPLSSSENSRKRTPRSAGGTARPARRRRPTPRSRSGATGRPARRRRRFHPGAGVDYDHGWRDRRRGGAGGDGRRLGRGFRGAGALRRTAGATRSVR